MIQKYYLKYDLLFKQIKNSEDSYDLKEAFKIMILSSQVSEDDKKSLISLKKDAINEEIKSLNLRIDSITNNGKTIAYLRMDISKLEKEIDKLDEMYKYRDYHKNLANAVREQNCIMEDLS